MCSKDGYGRWHGCALVPLLRRAMAPCALSLYAVCSCNLRTVGFGMGAFISLMSSSFAYEDPLIRQQQQAAGAISTTAKAREIFTEMGRGMWRSGKGFAKVTVLFAGTECVIESVSSCSLSRSEQTREFSPGVASPTPSFPCGSILSREMCCQSI